MVAKLKSFVGVGGKFFEVDVYGYSSRSVPGLDIIGLGSRGKLIREKINFITNRYVKKKKALKRYVISIESELPEEKIRNNCADLEFPILILYWSLANLIPLRQLDQVWAIGTVNVDFQIISKILKELEMNDHIRSSTEKRTFVHPRAQVNNFSHKSLIWEDLLDCVYRNNDSPSNDFG